MGNPALIFVPDSDGGAAGRWRRVCTEYCDRRGYEIVAVTADPSAVQTLLDRRSVDVVVVGHEGHKRLLRTLTPRVEVVTDDPPPEQGRRTRRRT